MKLYAAKLIDDDSSDKPKKSRKPKTVETEKEAEKEVEEEPQKTPDQVAKEPCAEKTTFDWEKHWTHCEEKFYKEAFQRFEIMQANQEKHGKELEEIKALAKKTPPAAPKKKKKTIVYASSAEEEEEEDDEETVIIKKKKKVKIMSPKKPRIEYDDYLFDSIFSDRRKV